MYETSQKWKENIYENVQCVMNIYIDDVLINPDYILDFKKGGNAFEEEFCLGGTPSQYIEMKIYKEQTINPKVIKVEYGIQIDNNSSYEIIPIGIYNIDDYTENDDDTITIKALDNMIKFEFNYDGSELVNEKGYATLLEVVQDICNKAGVELESTSFLNSDEKVSVYDNQLTAREYIGYIAESAGCFAFIDREGKLCFREFYQDETEIPLEMFGEYKWGEEFKISKVSYEDGVRSFKFGDDTRNNLWINQENMYIVDEEQIQNIYNEINNLVVNSFEGQTVIDPALDIGDKIIIDGKPVIYQGEMSLEGRFIAQISSKIQIKQKEETTVKKESQKVVNRRVQSEINQIDGKITQLIEENTETTEKLTKVEQDVDSITSTVASKDEVEEKINELKQTIEGTTNTITNTGGSNIFYYAKEYWNAVEENEQLGIEEYSSTDISQNTVSKLGYIVNNGNAIQKQIVKNGTYTIIFLYKKLIDLAVGNILINNISYELDVEEINKWEEKIIQVEITSNTIDIEIISDTDNSFIIADLMVNAGSEKQVWSQNANETITDTVKIGKGIQVESSSSNTYTRIDADGNRTYNKTTNERVAEMTDKGVYANELEVKGQAKINSLLIQEIDGQVWITGIGG